MWARGLRRGSSLHKLRFRHDQRTQRDCGRRTMTSKSASTTRRATPATRPDAKAGSRPPSTVSDAVSAVAGFGGTSTNAIQSPGSPSVARIGGSGTILSFARARSLQRTVGNNATAAVMGAGSGIDRLNTAPLASQSKGSPRQPLSRAVAVGSMPQVQGSVPART